MLLLLWRTPTLYPSNLHPTRAGAGYETDLSQCTVSAVDGISANGTWQLAAAAPAGTCKMLAAVRCRSGAAAVTLRAAAAPAPSGSPATLTLPAPGANSTTTTTATVVARLEASVGGAAYGAVCSDDGFDAAAADVACRTLGYAAGGVIYGAGAPAAPPPNATDPTHAVPVADVDAQGSYLGTLAALRCAGGEAAVGSCAAWRAASAGSAVPCRAAAWVACRVSSTATTTTTTTTTSG